MMTTIESNDQEIAPSVSNVQSDAVDSQSESPADTQAEAVSAPRSPLVPQRTLERLNHALGPVVAGMIIDAVDLLTFGPLGLGLGIPVGAFAGYWLGRSMRLEKHMCWICSVVAGIYCTIPGTEFLPLGTLVGALVRFQDEPQDN